jgi:hypothetical protein
MRKRTVENNSRSCIGKGLRLSPSGDNGHWHLFRRKWKINLIHIKEQKYSLLRDRIQDLQSFGLIYLEDARGINGFFSEELIPLYGIEPDPLYVPSVERLEGKQFAHVFYLRKKFDKELVVALRKCLEESPNA